MEFPDPNPHFPPPPRTKSLPMGLMTITFFALSILCTLGAHWMVKVPPVFTGLLLSAAVFMIATAVTFLRYRKYGAWRRGRILPALVVDAPFMSPNQARLGTAAVAAAGALTSSVAIATVAQQVVLRTWYNGRQRTVFVAPSSRGILKSGDIVWVVVARNVLEVSNLLQVAAPKEFRDVEVDEESAVWLLKTISYPTQT